MKHGLVTKIEKKFMIVKTENNDIERIKIRPNVKLGDRLSFEKRDIYKGFGKFSYRQIGTSLSMLIMVVLIGGFLFNQASDTRVYGIVSYDVNPSILIEINKDFNVITVRGDSEIIPTESKGLHVEVLLEQMTEKAVELNILEKTDTIVISYNKEDIPLAKYLEQNKSHYRIVLLFHETESKVSYGRTFIKEQLALNNIEIEEKETFINDAIQALRKDFKEVEGIYEYQPSTNEDISDEPPSTEEITVVEENPITEDPVTEETLVEETESINQTEIDALLTSIEEQKNIVDDLYKKYLNAKSLVDKKQSELNTKSKEIEDAKANLVDKQNGYQDIKDELSLLNNTKIALSNNLNVRDTEIATANTQLQEVVNSTKDDRNEVDHLRNRAEMIYNEAYELYRPEADQIIIQILDEIQNKNDQIDNYDSSATTDYSKDIETLETEKVELENMLTVIDTQNGTLPLDSYEFAMHYNQIYTTFNQNRLESNALKKEANSLQDDIDDVIEEAEKEHKANLETIENKYIEDTIMLKSTEESITGFERVLENFKISIKFFEDEVSKLENEYNTINSKYTTLNNDASYLYNQYLEEENLLKELERKYNESTDTE